ncbi:MAG: universal stress protein [Ginsengibacter sp.]
MKKILVISNFINLPTHLIAFAIETAKEISGELHGIFINESSEPAGLNYPFPNDMESTEIPLAEESIQQENTDLLNAQIKLFKDECLSAGAACKASLAHTLEEVLNLSRESDLIITEVNTDYPHFSLKDILTSARCPVFAVGTNKPVIEKVILAFDGSESSKYAIQKFKDLFAHFCPLPAFLVTINLSPLEILEQKEFMYNLLPGYFPNLKIEELTGAEKEELHRFLKQHDSNSLIVMGAFGRSAVSGLFHPSLANTVLEEGNISLFNAHE